MRELGFLFLLEWPGLYKPTHSALGSEQQCWKSRVEKKRSGGERSVRLTSFPSPPPLSFANGKVQERGGRRANADFRTRGFFSKEVSWLVGGCRGEEKGDPPLLTVVRAVKQSGGGGGTRYSRKDAKKREKKETILVFFGRQSLSLTVATCLPVVVAVFSCSKPCDAPAAGFFFVCLGGFPQKRFDRKR